MSSSSPAERGEVNIGTDTGPRHSHRPGGFSERQAVEQPREAAPTGSHAGRAVSWIGWFLCCEWICGPSQRKHGPGARSHRTAETGKLVVSPAVLWLHGV